MAAHLTWYGLTLPSSGLACGQPLKSNVGGLRDQARISKRKLPKLGQCFEYRQRVIQSDVQVMLAVISIKGRNDNPIV